MSNDFARDINARLTDEARATLRTRIDLDAFLALKTPEHDGRAARWQQWDRATKADAIIQMLGRLGLAWTDESVAEWVAKYDEKWGATIETDVQIPSAAAIAELAKERADVARLHDDIAAARRLDRVRMNVLHGARLTWHLGDLLIQSVNNPGAVYSVNRCGCTCPSTHECWHLELHGLLLDMFETAADTADMEADAAERYEAARQLGARACQLRSGYLAA